MKILIVDGGLQGLSCGESLYREHAVSIVASDLQCQKSKFFKKVYSDVEADESLLALLSKEHFDVLIPVGDMCVPFISENKELIEKQYGVKCAVPSIDCVRKVEDKNIFMSFCLQENLPHPKTMAISVENLEDAAQNVGFPSLIKPNFSVGARGITRVESLDELKQHFPAVRERFGECTLQEFIDNKEYYYNVMLYRNAQGEFLAHAIIKIVRMYPVGAGSSSCCISVENDELLEICKSTLDKLNWVGMADFDVLQRLDNKEYKIIEINARVPASLRAAAISGVNFPEIIVRDVLGMPQKIYQYQPGKTMRYLGIDIMWLLKTKKLFGSHPSWLKFFGKNLYYQDIYANDVSTWWTWLAEGLSKLGNRNKKLR